MEIMQTVLNGQGCGGDRTLKRLFLLVPENIFRNLFSVKSSVLVQDVYLVRFIKQCISVYLGLSLYLCVDKSESKLSRCE